MDKSPDAFRTISEVADDLQTPAHVLRFWESRFPQVRPVKRAGGRRYYRPSDVALLAGIRRLLHDEGMTIRGVQKVLREQGVRHVAGLSQDDLAIADAAAELPAEVDGDQDDAVDADALPEDALPEDAPPEDAPPEEEAAEGSPPAPVSEPAPAEAPDAAASMGDAVDAPPVAATAAPEPAAASPEPLPGPALEPPPIADLPLFAGRDMPAAPVKAPLRTPPLGPGDDDTPTLAARLRALRPGALAHRGDEAAAIRTALADLHARLSDRARGPRR